MAHFAVIKDNTVQQVVVVADKVLWDENKNEVEQKGIDFLNRLIGKEFEYRQTSYTARIRKNYAGIGYVYDASRDAYISPRPMRKPLNEESKELSGEYELNEETCRWEFKEDNKFTTRA